jgi:16S rRNA processing protein RimM
MSSSGNSQELIFVARTVKTRGLKGELVAELLTDFPERFAQISELTGIGPNGESKLLSLESIETAKSLVGYELGLPEDERVQLSAGEFYDWELEGCSVKLSSDGSAVGKVREIMRTGAVELLVVEDEKTRREHFIPMTQSIVVEIDLAEQKIMIDPPEGLLDL